jgi:hypothetical protein
MQFTLSEDDVLKVHSWLKNDVYPEVILKQKKSGKFDDNPIARDFWAFGVPYSGAIGGGPTYSFTTTSLGVILKVSCHGFEKDFTDYDNW